MMLAGAGEPGALHRRQTDRATTDHHHAVAMRDRAEIKRRADPGHDTATDQAGPVERDLLRHHNGLLVRHDAIFAERSDDTSIA